MEKPHTLETPLSERLLQPVLEVLQGNDPAEVCEKYGISREVLDKRFEAYQTSRRRMALAESLVTGKVGRNDLCPCGSGKKYKKCCLPLHEEARKDMPPDYIQEMEGWAKLKKKLDEDVKRGFDLLYSRDFPKARKLAENLLKSYPEDDRLHNILVMADLATGAYDSALDSSRSRWQVAVEEKAFFQEHGHYKRAGAEGNSLVHFYSPSTWLEELWISQRASAYDQAYHRDEGSPLKKLVDNLDAANDVKRFPERQEAGYEARRKALDPVLKKIEAQGTVALPYLLPLTYCFSWASLFVPDLLGAWGDDASILLLAELSMFRFPNFTQKCLSNLERLGDAAVAQIDVALRNNSAFDELKTGMIAVLGNIHTPESFRILTRLIDHENPSVMSWAAQALEKHDNPEAEPFLEKARERLGALSQVAGAIRELTGNQPG
jgi:hypothetical protein